MSFGTVLRDNVVANEQEQTFGTIISPDEHQHPPIPKQFDGRLAWKVLLSPIKNQGRCGACYAFSVVGMLADRYSIQTLGQVKPNLNPMEVVVCMKDILSSDEFLKSRTDYEFEEQVSKKQSLIACKGNTMYNAARSMYVQGAVEESCVSEKSIWEFINRNGRVPLCLEIEGDKFPSTCIDPKKPMRYWMAEEYYTIGTEVEVTEKTVHEIQLEIMRWGPVAAGFQVFDDFLTDYKDGTTIYTHPKKEQKTLGGHAIRIVGWGEEIQEGRNVKYWIIANSWGSQWGDEGYGKIEMLIPELQLEMNVVSVWPQLLDSDFPAPLEYNDLVPRVSDEDDKIKEQLRIDPVTMYAEDHVEKIMKGLMKGSLDPVINPLLLPVYAEFWAYQIGSKPIELRNGTHVYTLSELQQSSKWKMWLLILLLIIIVIVIIVLYKRKK